MGKRSVLQFTAVLFSISTLFASVPALSIDTFQQNFGPGNFGYAHQDMGADPKNSPMDPKAGEFQQDNKDCSDSQKEADKQCNSDTSPQGQQAQQASQNQSQTPGGSGQQNCDSMASFLPALMGLLKGMQGSCQGAQQNCKAKCQKTQSTAQSKCAGLQPPQLQACQGDASQSQGHGSKGQSTCQKYDANLAAIASALANAAMQMAAAQQCQKDTQKDCTKPENQNTDQCKAAFNCNLDQYASDPKCVCARNPRASKDCPGFQAAEDAAEAEQKALNNTSSGSPSSTGTPSAGTDGGGATAASPSLPGFPSGGGGSGGSAAKAAERAQDGTAKTAIPEVNAGDYGGNNGPAGKIGGGYPDGDIRKLGQKKVLSRDLVRRIASKDGFTGAFGRDNWQKVHERYRDNRPTFVGP